MKRTITRSWCKKHIVVGRVGPRDAPWYTGGKSYVSNGLIQLDSFECMHCGLELKPRGWSKVKPQK